jgi:hypothetical protein
MRATRHIGLNASVAKPIPKAVRCKRPTELRHQEGKVASRAVGWFMDIPQLQSILLLEGSDRCTLSSKKTPREAQPPIANFRRAKGKCYSCVSVPMLVFERNSNRFDVNVW